MWHGFMVSGRLEESQLVQLYSLISYLFPSLIWSLRYKMQDCYVMRCKDSLEPEVRIKFGAAVPVPGGGTPTSYGRADWISDCGSRGMTVVGSVELRVVRVALRSGTRGVYVEPRQRCAFR
ncbi:hypothetical protein BHE74_00015540 [Ensete ventricosum]|nr:hypothetical protein BHE74_00015540 [Ensete ventricosum]